MRILVSGMLAGDPWQGGATWAALQYPFGLERLGHEVMFVEPVAAERIAVAEPYFRRVVAETALSRATLLVGSRGETLGEPYDVVRAWAARADVLINLSGLLTDELLCESIPIRVYMDLDPAFSQLWHATGNEVRFAGHTHHVTVGRALTRGTSLVPTCGIDWIPTVPPVVLERWPVGETIDHDALTTVGNWRSYGSIVHDGVFYGQRAHSLRRLIELPQRTEARLAPALAIDPAERDDLAALAAHGWELLDPRSVAGTPAAYASFVRGSLAELGVAKSGYVESLSGWLSDRSACYLASGRPVVAQDTGFSAFMETGEGLLAFSTVDEAAEAIDEVARDYARHSHAARALAQEYFDSDRVLTSLLEAVGAM